MIELADGHTLHRSVERIRLGNDAKLVIGLPDAPEKPKADPQLIILLKDAHRAKALALAKPKLALEDLATRFGRSTERYKRLLQLSYRSPTIIDAIIASRQPPQLTNRFLQNLDGLPVSWVEQERLLLGRSLSASSAQDTKTPCRRKMACKRRDLAIPGISDHIDGWFFYVEWRKSAIYSTTSES